MSYENDSDPFDALGMALIANYPLRHSSAQFFADLVVAESDLRDARSLADLALKEVDAGLPDFRIYHALWTASVVRYARAFTEGALRFPRQEAIDSLSVGGAAFHAYIMDMRHGFLVHSVGSMEVPIPTVQIRTDDAGNHEIQAINYIYGYCAGAPRSAIEDFLTLTQEMMGFVTKKMEAEKPMLLELARGIGADVFVAAGMVSPNPTARAPRRRRSPLGK